MSTTAEDLSTTLSEDKPSEPSVDATDEIANLLVGDDEPKVEEDEGEETQTKASNQDEGEESNEEEASDDDEGETTLEGVADGDELTWESTLGVKEGDLSFNEDGDINGVNVKVNGESSTISMPDLIAGFQNNKFNTEKSQAHAEEVKNFGIQKEQTEKVYASKLEAVDTLSKHFETQLISEYDAVDWNKLRIEDPAEYAAMRSDFSAKAGEMQKIKDAIDADKESANADNLAAFNEQSQTRMKLHYDQMLANNPEWKDEKVRNAAKTEYKDFVIDKYGFNDNEFESVFDARLIELIKDAKKYHAGAAVAAKKRNKPVPKFQKSRGVVKDKASKLDKLTVASRKAHGSEKRDLQASAVAELLIG